MASEVDICNLALSDMWQEAVITSIIPPDGTVEAQHASVFYPIVRDKLLEMHSWYFATSRKSLALFSTNEAENSWGYSYAMPGNCLKPRIILLPTAARDTEAQRHEVEAREDGQVTIYTDVEDAVLVYTRNVTDTSKFTPMFVTAFGFLLAQYMAGPITKNPKTVRLMAQSFTSEYIQATAADASARRKDMLRSHTPAHLAARLF